ncbi:MAG: PilZ domain-containing protein [Pseudomonadota bacterium]
MAPIFSKSSKKGAGKLDLSRAIGSSAAPTPKASPLKRMEGGGRRKYRRRDAWAVCNVISREGHRVDGVLLNLSESGARVRFRSRSSLPNVVRLSSSRYKINRIAHVVWQDTYDAGLHFVDE